MTITRSQLSGFADPVFDSQSTFRAIMDAMARPGSIKDITLDFTPPVGINMAAAATVQALCDFETALWVCPQMADAVAIADYCAFQTGATRGKSASTAQFALIDLATSQLRLQDFVQGEPDYPDRSTTIIAMVSSLTLGPTRTLSGPGIQSTATLSIADLPDDFAGQWAVNQASFPLGVDVIFCCGSSLLALPRSTSLSEG